jgi:hypothetical protein
MVFSDDKLPIPRAKLTNCITQKALAAGASPRPRLEDSNCPQTPSIKEGSAASRRRGGRFAAGKGKGGVGRGK